jgi:hypothetical protein
VARHALAWLTTSAGTTADRVPARVVAPRRLLVGLVGHGSPWGGAVRGTAGCPWQRYRTDAEVGRYDEVEIVAKAKKQPVRASAAAKGV